MKQFNVENITNTSSIPDNYVGQPIEAATAEEAIAFAIDYIVDHADGAVEVNGREITVTREDGRTEVFFNFTAKEMDR